MARKSRSGHRPKRDTQKAQEVSDLKRENHHLKRTISRLRKQLDQMSSLAPDEDDITPEVLADVGASESRPKCPECGSGDISRFDTPMGKVIRACRTCGWRN